MPVFLLRCMVFIASLLPYYGQAIMRPESSMITIREEDGGGSINITNTDDQPQLLYIKVYDLPDDPQPTVIVTQPVIRVAAGATQRVRFILNSSHPLSREHLKRVIFEGIKPKTSATPNNIAINIRQDLPIIIHPQGLPMLPAPWKMLKWSVQDNRLRVRNTSKYIVRLAQQVTLQPSASKALLEKSYILPGQQLEATVQNPLILSNTLQVSMDTFSKYGFETGRFELPVGH